MEAHSSRFRGCTKTQKKLRNSCEAILVQVGRHSSRKHKNHCGIRARRFRAKWKDTLADWRVRENTKNWKNSRKAISSQVEGHTPADFEGARNHKKLRNSRKAISVEVERHSSRFGGARKHKNTAEFSSQVQGHSSRLEDGQKHKNCRIRARRFRAGWGDTPATAGVREKRKIAAKLIGS